jgi:hypothetical protein
LRFAPRTATRLGIADQVRRGKLENHLGSGAYGSGFLLPSGQVLKLTIDPADAYVAWQIVKEGRPVPGLIDIYTAFRIDLPFTIHGRFGSGDVVYGTVSERVVVGFDFEKDNVGDWFYQKAQEAGLSRSQVDRSMRSAFEALDNRDVVRYGQLDRLAPEARAAAEIMREGADWCRARGISYWTDWHRGNYGVTVRNGRIEPMKNDIGHGSIYAGQARQELRQSLPLAKNRVSRGRGSRGKGSRGKGSRSRTSRGLVSNRPASRGRGSRGRTSSRRTSRGRYSK